MALLPSLPGFELPVSNSTIGVSIIDTTVSIRMPTPFFYQDQIPGFNEFNSIAYSFLLEHPSGHRMVFDLGVRTDPENLPPVTWDPFAEQIEQGIVSLTIEKDVATILTDEGISLDDIDEIILSHWHIDHIGDPSTFPNSTALVVGPTFQETLLPGYPADPQGRILESDYQGRTIREIDFDADPNTLDIGRFKAIDYFGDGSFYLLSAPGHTFGHIIALARTTPSTFILLAADTYHHGGSVRPTQYLPLPDPVAPSPFSDPPFRPGSACPAGVIASTSPYGARDQPFFQRYSEAWDRNLTEVVESVTKTSELDAFDNIFVVIAHDDSLLDVVDYFPKKANDWKAKGWKEDSRWKFLADFRGAINSTCSVCH